MMHHISELVLGLVVAWARRLRDIAYAPRIVSSLVEIASKFNLPADLCEFDLITAIQFANGPLVHLDDALISHVSETELAAILKKRRQTGESSYFS